MTRQTRRQLTTRSALIAALALLTVFAAAAKPDFETRGGVYADASAPFLGFGALANISQQWFFNPNLEYASGDRRDEMTANFDLHYDLPLDAPFFWWVGGGPALVHNHFDSGRNDTVAALNALSGISARNGQIRPFVQGKIVIKSDPEAVLGVGLRF